MIPVLAPGNLYFQVFRGGRLLVLAEWLLLFLRKHRPKEMQPAIPHDRDEVIALDIQVHLFPRCPDDRGITLFALAVIIDVRSCPRPSKDVQNIDNKFGACIVIFLLVIHARHFQPRHSVEFFEIVQKGVFGAVQGYFLLEQLVFQLLEERCFVIAEFRLDPVFGVEEDFSVRFPQAVVLHPSRPMARVPVGEREVVFQVHQHALDEELD